MTKYSIDEKKQAIGLFNNGVSVNEAARRTGISETVIRRLVRQAEKHGLKTPL